MIYFKVRASMYLEPAQGLRKIDVGPAWAPAIVPIRHAQAFASAAEAGALADALADEYEGHCLSLSILSESEEVADIRERAERSCDPVVAAEAVRLLEDLGLGLESDGDDCPCPNCRDKRGETSEEEQVFDELEDLLEASEADEKRRDDEEFDTLMRLAKAEQEGASK